MSGDYRRLLGFLDGVGRRVTAAAAVRGLVHLTILAAVAAGFHLFVLERVALPPWTVFAFYAVASAAFWAVTLRTLRLLLRRPSRQRAARLVEGRRPEWSTDVTSALQVGDAAAQPANTSPGLVRALLAATSVRLRDLSPADFVPAGPLARRAAVALLAAGPVLAAAGGGVPARALTALVNPFVFWPSGEVTFAVEPGSARIARGAPLAVTAALTGPFGPRVALEIDASSGTVKREVMRPAGRGVFRFAFPAVSEPFRYRVLAGRSSSAWFDVTAVPPPAAGNFEAVYTYPAYTGLPERRVRGGGDLEALRGTAVELSFAVNKPLAAGRLLLGDGRYELAAAGEGRYRSIFYLNGEETYRIELVDEEGFENREPLEFTIRYLEDDPPAIELNEPEGEVEVDLLMPIVVGFAATDDFGLARISLVYRLPGGEERRETVTSPAGRDRVSGTYTWDAGGIEAAPGDAVAVWLEATDTDTVSGPKTGVSETFVLRVRDPRERHEEAKATLEDLTDQLVDLLADELDAADGFEEMETKAREEWEKFDWSRMEELREARERLEEAARRAAETAADLTRRLEEDSLSRAETYLQMSYLSRGLERLGAENLAPMDDLLSSVDPADAGREEVEERAGQLGDFAEDAVARTEEMLLMAEQMQREQNMADVEDTGRDMLDMQNRLLEEMEKLAPGDREGIERALDELDRLQEMMRDLMEALSREAAELPEEFLNSDALQDLSFDPMLEALERIRQMLRSGDVEGARREAEKLLEEMSDLLNRLQQAAEDFQNETAAALEQLQGKTIPVIEELIEEQKAVLDGTEDAGRRIASRRRGAPPGETPLTPDEEAELEALAGREGKLREKTAGLADEVEALKAVLPFLDPAVEERLRGAGEDMGEAAGALGRREPVSAVAPELAALAKLTQARNQARSSLQGMQQMQGLRQGKSGVPLFLSGMRNGMGQGPSMLPTSSFRPGGRRGIDLRNFRIPGREDFTVPSRFRQEILKSLDEGYPRQYEGRVREYFQRITE